MDQGQLIMKLVAAQGAVTSLRRALRRLVAAEREFSRDTGIKLDDLVSDAVERAELVLELTKHVNEEPSAASSSAPKDSK